MSKFVIHKKGFFYTDEAYEAVDDAKGSIVGTYTTLEEAQKAKANADLASMCGLKGMLAVDFFLYREDYDAVCKQMEDFYQKEFGLTIEDRDYFNFPSEINTEQAKVFLEILALSFHDIVEYADDVVLNPDDFNLDEQELGEF